MEVPAISQIANQQKPFWQECKGFHKFPPTNKKSLEEVHGNPIGVPNPPEIPMHNRHTFPKPTNKNQSGRSARDFTGHRLPNKKNILAGMHWQQTKAWKVEMGICFYNAHFFMEPRK